MNESLRFVDLPELSKKWKNRYKCRLSDVAKLIINGMQAKFSINELNTVLELDVKDIVKFFEANGWNDCSKKDKDGNYITDELIFRQSREPVDNVKPYYELELINNPEKLELFNRFLKRLDFSKFYHVSTVSPEKLAKTTGLRCKNKSKVKFERRIYMISGKMALKVLIIEGNIDSETSIAEAQKLLDEKLYKLAEAMCGDIKLAWDDDHDEPLEKLYIYELTLPANWPVYKDPEYDDEDEFSACACFTIQNIPMKFIKFMAEDDGKDLFDESVESLDEGIFSKVLGAGALAAGLAFGNSGIDISKAKPGHVPNDKVGFGKTTVHLQQRYNYPQDKFGVPTAYKVKDDSKLNLMSFKKEVELTKKKILATPDSMLRQYGKDHLTEISKLMVKTANKYNIDVDLLLAIAGTETNFDNDRESNKGARGMMQITKTAAQDSHERLQKKSPKTFKFNSFRDLSVNIDNAGRIVADLSVRRNNVVEMIFASYNGGTAQATSWRAYAQKSKVDKNGKPVKPLTKETKNYVERCMALYKKYKEVQKTYLQKT